MYSDLPKFSQSLSFKNNQLFLNFLNDKKTFFSNKVINRKDRTRVVFSLENLSLSRKKKITNKTFQWKFLMDWFPIWNRKIMLMEDKKKQKRIKNEQNVFARCSSLLDFFGYQRSKTQSNWKQPPMAFFINQSRTLKG